jgi:hypothetical protein
MSLNQILGAVGIGSSIFSTILGANAANHAADTQAGAATDAAKLASDAQNKALDFQKLIYNNALGLSLPGIATGQSGLANLAYLLGLPIANPSLQGAPATGTGTSATGTGTTAPGTPLGFGGSSSAPNNMPGTTGPNAAGGLNFGGIDPNGSDGPQGGSSTPYYYNPFQGGASIDTQPPGAGTPYFNPQGADLRQNRTDAHDARMPVDIDPGPRGGGGLGTVGAGSGTGKGTTGTGVGATLPGGSSNTNSLINPVLGGFGSLMKMFDEKFAAPTGATEVNDPGYKFRFNEGVKGLEHGAAARGNLLGGAQAKALTRFGQDYASNEYGSVYNRAMNEYLNRFNMYNTNQNTQFNRLAAIAGIGQTNTNQLINAGENAAGNNSSILLNGTNAINSQLNNAAYQRASGYVNSTNAITGGISNLTQLLDMIKSKPKSVAPGTPDYSSSNPDDFNPYVWGQ